MAKKAYFLKKMIFKSLIFFLYLFFLNPFIFSASQIEDLNKIYDGAINAWFDERIDQAIADLEYIVSYSTDDKLTLKAGKDLVVLLNEKNESSLALAYINKLEVFSSNDPYLEFEKMWAEYNLSKYKQSLDTSDNLLSYTADEDIIYFTRFLSALVNINVGGYEKSIDELQSIYKNYPSLLAPSAYMLATNYERMKKRLNAINFLKDSLNYDPQNIQSMISLANLYYDVSYYLPAFQSYFTLKEIDYLNDFFAKKANKLMKKINKNPDEIFYWSRLGWPVHNEPLKNRKIKTPLKINLYSDLNYNPSYLNSFYFIANTDFEIYDSILGKVHNGKKNMMYSVKYIKSNRIFEIRDNSNSKIHSTRKNFEIKLRSENGVILIKSPSFEGDYYGVNRGDKEITSSLEIETSTSGMKLTNRTYLEHILPSIVSTVKGPKETEEFIKALSVVIRTMLKKEIKERNGTIPDSLINLEFKGIQFEKENIVSLVEQTQNEVLIKNGNYYADYSLNSAGKTLDGVDDNSTKPQALTPYSLFKWITFEVLKKPENYSIPDDKINLSDITWTLILEPKWIEDRVNKFYKIGNIKNIYVLKRNRFGIVESIKIEGSAGNVTIEGVNEVSKFLSANTLRSNLFWIRSVMKGKFADFFIIKGVGTGNFKGMCIYGANYLSKNMGYNYKQILKHYFPDSIIKDEN